MTSDNQFAIGQGCVVAVRSTCACISLTKDKDISMLSFGLFKERYQL